MVILYKDPKGERIFQRSMSQAGTILGNQLPEDDSSRYLELEQHCKDLEGRLAKSGEVSTTSNSYTRPCSSYIIILLRQIEHVLYNTNVLFHIEHVLYNTNVLST